MPRSRANEAGRHPQGGRDNASSLEGRVSTGNNKRAITAEVISDSGKSDETDHHPRNQKIQKLVNEIINDDVTSAAEVSSSPLERFDHKDALSATTSQMTPEVIPPPPPSIQDQG